MRRASSALVAVTLVSGLLGGCGGNGDGGGKGTKGEYATDGTFTLAVGGDPGSFNPYQNPLLISTMFLAYDSLVNVTPDGKIVSGLAEKWKVDATSATFTLRSGITCSDGTALTASQVVAAINFVKDPKNQSPFLGLSVPTDPFEVKADDAARTVSVTLEKPFSFLLNTMGSLPIVCAEGLKNVKAMDDHSFGTGPFVLESVVPGDVYTFRRRDGYTWGPDGASTDASGTPKTVKLKVVTNETTAANLLQSGQVNAASVVGADRARLTSQGLDHFDIHLIHGQFWFSQREGRPTTDLAVRKALISAVNLDEVSNVSTSGNGVRSKGLVSIEPKTCPGDTVGGRLPAFAPDTAGTLLDEAGWTLADGGARTKAGQELALDLHYSTSAGDGITAAAELIAEKWRDVGVKVKLVGDADTALNSTLFATGDFDVYFKGINFTLPSQMASYLSGPVPPKGQNFAGINNPEYSQLATAAARTPGNAGCRLWNRAEEAIISNLDSVPVSDTLVPYFLNGAEATTNGVSAPVPTSIRVLK